MRRSMWLYRSSQSNYAVSPPAGRGSGVAGHISSSAGFASQAAGRVSSVAGRVSKAVVEKFRVAARILINTARISRFAGKIKRPEPRISRPAGHIATSFTAWYVGAKRNQPVSTGLPLRGLAKNKKDVKTPSEISLDSLPRPKERGYVPPSAEWNHETFLNSKPLS
jgi:hypothetical protein